MARVRLVCDSTADLPPAYVAEHGVRVVPLKVLFGEESLVDGVDIDAAGFYARMRRSTVHPTTSQPTPAEFEAAFRAAGADGDAVVCTCMSSAMSGTWQSAMSAREAVAGDVDVHVVDTATVAMGHHVAVREAVQLAEGGASAPEVVERIRDILGRERSVFTVATLEYLRRGGRIGGARALVGSVLDIKPVLQVVDGRIERYKQVRTRAKAIETIAQELAGAVRASGRRARCIVGSADDVDDRRRLAELVAPHCDGEPALVDIGPVVGAHAGPGTLGMVFYLV